jgi:hypothetical protein
MGVLVPLGLALGASLRLSHAEAHLRALGPRPPRVGGGGEQS